MQLFKVQSRFEIIKHRAEIKKGSIVLILTIIKTQFSRFYCKAVKQKSGRMYQIFVLLYIFLRKYFKLLQYVVYNKQCDRSKQCRDRNS